MDTIDFDLSHTIFKNDLVNYKNKSMSSLNILFNRGINKSKVETNDIGYMSCNERPFPFNDKYNKIILALRYNKTVLTMGEHNLLTCSLDKKYHQFLYIKPDLPPDIQEALEVVVEQYGTIQPIIKAPLKYYPKNKIPVLLGRRKIEKQLSYYIENRLIEINKYYQTLLIDYDPIKNQKEKIKTKGNEEYVCECGYKGVYRNSSRHLKTALHTKRLQAITDQST